MGETSHDGKWGTNTALFGILIVLAVIFVFWWCYQSGKDKADLAASIQQLYGRVNCIEPVVKNNAQQLYDINGDLKGIVQGVQDFKERSYENLAVLNRSVFTTTFGCNRNRNGGGCNSTGYRKQEKFESCGTELIQVETCGDIF